MKLIKKIVVSLLLEKRNGKILLNRFGFFFPEIQIFWRSESAVSTTKFHVPVTSYQRRVPIFLFEISHYFSILLILLLVSLCFIFNEKIINAQCEQNVEIINI